MEKFFIPAKISKLTSRTSTTITVSADVLDGTKRSVTRTIKTAEADLVKEGMMLLIDPNELAASSGSPEQQLLRAGGAMSAADESIPHMKDKKQLEQAKKENVLTTILMTDESKRGLEDYSTYARYFANKSQKCYVAVNDKSETFGELARSTQDGVEFKQPYVYMYGRLSTEHIHAYVSEVGNLKVAGLAENAANIYLWEEQKMQRPKPQPKSKSPPPSPSSGAKST